MRYSGRKVNVPIHVEYCRRVHDLGSLPILKALLEEARSGSGIVFFDDVRRLFARCPMDRRGVLLEEIGGFGDCRYDLRTRARLGELSTPCQIADDCNWPEKVAAL